MIPYRPEFVPGDLVEVMAIEFPPKSGKFTKNMNLYGNIGQPPLRKPDSDISELIKEMNEHRVGCVQNGHRCLVVAVRFFDRDKKWFYLLRGPDYSKCFGWTRSASKLKKVT